MSDIIERLFFADLVRETSDTMGTTPFVLNGASNGYRRFGDAVPEGRPFYYAIINISKQEEWEVGIGHIDDSNMLQRSPIISSQDNQKVDFESGIKNVSLTVSADWFMAQNEKITPALHEHQIADVDSLQQALDGKQNKGDYAPALHGHAIGDIAELNAQLSSKQPIGNYADAAHRHNLSDIKLSAPVKRSFAKPADQLIVADLENDPSGGASYNIQARSFVYRDSLGQYICEGVLRTDNGTIAGTVASFRGANGNAFEINMDGLGNTRLFAPDFNVILENSFSSGRVSIRTGGSDRWCVQSSGHYAPVIDNAYNIGSAATRIANIFAANGTISTSDENSKTEIGDIPDAWLDAWGDVEWRRFKYVGGSRFHIGLIAQQVHHAFAAYDVDAFDIGLLCCDHWDDEYEVIMDDDGNESQGAKIKEAGALWGLRYDQCFAIEAAWQRRENERLSEKIANLSGHG